MDELSLETHAAVAAHLLNAYVFLNRAIAEFPDDHPDATELRELREQLSVVSRTLHDRRAMQLHR